jgi:spore maturation protein CgeB
MRILVSGNAGGDTFARNIAATLEGMRHTVLALDEAPVHHENRDGFWPAFWRGLSRLYPRIEAWWHRRLIEQASTFQPDLILITHGCLEPEVVRRIRAVTGAKLAAWYPDHQACLGRQYLLASELDAWFFKDSFMVETFRAKLGIDAHYLPEACNPAWHRRVTLTHVERAKYGCDLCTAGNMYYYRARMLEMFKGYDLKIWGHNYPRWLISPLRSRYPGVFVAELEKAKAFNAAKIVLNAMHPGEIAGVNCRLFEAAGCGAFQIADWKPALPELFEPEREIVTFRTREELKEKVDYYLAHPKEREAIAERAYRRAHREHTYELRLTELLGALGFSAKNRRAPVRTAYASA